MINSVYAEISGARYLSCELDYAMISGEIAEDVESMRSTVRNER